MASILIPLIMLLVNLFTGLFASNIKKIKIVKRLYNQVDKINRASVTLRDDNYKIINLSNYKDLGDKIILIKLLHPMIESRILALENTSFIVAMLYGIVIVINIMLLNDVNTKQYALSVSFGALVIFVVKLVIIGIMILEQRIILKKNKLLTHGNN